MWGYVSSWFYDSVLLVLEHRRGGWHSRLEPDCTYYNPTAPVGYRIQSETTWDWQGRGYRQLFTIGVDNIPDIWIKMVKLCRADVPHSKECKVRKEASEQGVAHCKANKVLRMCNVCDAQCRVWGLGADVGSSIVLVWWGLFGSIGRLFTICVEGLHPPVEPLSLRSKGTSKTLSEGLVTHHWRSSFNCTTSVTASVCVLIEAFWA